MEIRKVYDELYGMIEDLKRKISGIQPGDTVTITPALDSGTKVADYAIGDTEGSLYAPTIPPETAGVYSTEKTKIGTWYDGSDLYRIVTTSTIIAAGSSISLADVITADDELLFFDVINNSGNYIVMNGFNGNVLSGGDMFDCYYDKTTNSIAYYGTAYPGDAVIILYYHDKPTPTPPENDSKNRRKK